MNIFEISLNYIKGNLTFMDFNNKLRTPSVEEIIKYFQKEGMEISKEEAELIIEFLSNLTLMVIKQYISKD